LLFDDTDQTNNRHEVAAEVHTPVPGAAQVTIIHRRCQHLIIDLYDLYAGEHPGYREAGLREDALGPRDGQTWAVGRQTEPIVSST